ncbi:GAF domain-containing protein [Persicobacter sp. CCB-QB2]|uniref:GAF domain-containing protein n=1 Tax=Persicobacter sp. CCB-QB2 TaxID=1561025 RepID=UPI0012FC5793|nr:GAF domain-containing protein [Persicobacter sp. CCB-QB2]
MQLSFALVGFLLFKKEEKGLFVIANLIAISSFVYLVTVEGKNTNEIDTSLFTSGFMHYVSVFSALVISFFIMLTFRFINTQNQEKTLKLMGDIKKQQEEMTIKNNELNKYIGEIEVKQLEDNQRQWIAEGQSKVDYLLRTEEDKDAVFDKLLSFLIKYMEVNQGAVFLVQQEEKENQYLEMVGCYAYNRKKFVNKKINIGEGLIGQCYLEQEKIFLTEIPDNYINITSGLGESNPTNLIVVPFLYNDEVVAILELASFKAVLDYQITFLENMGQSVAAFVMNHRINVRTQKLLEESQMHAEMLRAQEEEMRQNMEELTATQEEAERRTLAFQQEIKNKELEIEELRLKINC